MEHIVDRLADFGFIPTARGSLSSAVTLRGPMRNVIVLSRVDGRVAVDLGEASGNLSDALLAEWDVAAMAAIRSAEATAFLRTPSKRSYGRGGL